MRRCGTGTPAPLPILAAGAVPLLLFAGRRAQEDHLLAYGLVVLLVVALFLVYWRKRRRLRRERS